MGVGIASADVTISFSRDEMQNHKKWSRMNTKYAQQGWRRSLKSHWLGIPLRILSFSI